MLFTAVPPAVLNSPAATRSPFGIGGADATLASSPRKPPMPEPIGDQFVPSHRAIRLAAMPPMLVKWLPATRSPFGRAARTRTELFEPAPSDNHVLPFQRTRWLDTPPPPDWW